MEKLIKLFKYLQSFFPTELPKGMTAFDAWADELIELSGAPANDTTKFALATMILHLGATDAKKAKQFFIRSLHKTMANQIAAGKMQAIKEKHEADMVAARAKEVAASVDQSNEQQSS